MKNLKFNKEENLWYIDLPEWTGHKKDLLMVAGADKLLDKLAGDKNTVTLMVSEDKPVDPGFDKLTKLMNTPLFGGATYLSKYWPVWLCKVTEFIYNGRMPDVLYYKVSE